MVEKPAASTPPSANAIGYRRLVFRPQGDHLNGHRTTAFSSTSLARVGLFHGYDARPLLPWLREVGGAIGLIHSRWV